MPVLRFHLLDLYYAQVTGGFTVTCTTNAACHLYLRYSDNFPWIHRKPIERRGLVIGWDAMYCFTAYHHIEQNEAGDTFTHTFTWPGWKNCERRYFYFWGTMGGQDMVSDTPIFWLHYLEVEPTEMLTIKGRGCFWNHYHSGGTTWSHLIEGPPNTFHGHTIERVTNFLNSYSTTPVWRRYQRGIMQFELGDLSAWTILAARIKLLCYQPYTSNYLVPWQWAFFPYKTGLTPKDLPDYNIGDWDKINACPDTHHCSPFAMDTWAVGTEWRTFPLNAPGIAYAQEGGRRTWWIRSFNEASTCDAPGWARYKISVIDFYNTIPDDVPILELDVIEA